MLVLLLVAPLRRDRYDDSLENMVWSEFSSSESPLEVIGISILLLPPLPPRPSSSLLVLHVPIEADICICCMVRCERTRPLLLLLPLVALRSLEVLAAPELFLRLLDWEAGGMEGRSGRSDMPSNSKPSSSEEEAAKAEEEDASVSADAEAAVRLRLLQEEVLDEEEEEDDRAASPSSSIIVVMCYRCCSIMYCGGMAFWRAREGGVTAVTAENDAKFDLGPSSSQLLWPSGRSACPTGAGVTHPSELILPAHMETDDVAKKAVREKRLVWPSSEIVWSGRHPPTASAHRHKRCAGWKKR